MQYRVFYFAFPSAIYFKTEADGSNYSWCEDKCLT
jgi:hypothetical protein